MPDGWSYGVAARCRLGRAVLGVGVPSRGPRFAWQAEQRGFGVWRVVSRCRERSLRSSAVESATGPAVA